MSAAHRESHLDLLQTFHRGRPRSVDAIVVSAGRPSQHLAPAAALADQLGCMLVALRSPGGPEPVEIAARSTEWPSLRWHTAQVPDGYDHPLLQLTSSAGVEMTEGRLGLLSVKRNVGLILGRLLDWRTVMFLDDDIVSLDADVIREAASGLDRSAAVGLAVADWPDNSVVCHANRLGGGAQQVFVSGSALLVDCTRPFGFFPNIYNEDWLFLFDALQARTVSRTRHVGQLPYWPYADPNRATVEEFGEVMAEGLIDALHRRLSPTALRDAAYWTGFLERRRMFIARTAQRVGAAAPDDDVDAALGSLHAAEERRGDITAAACAGYVADWRADTAEWHRRITLLPRFPTFEAAAGYLGLTASLVGLIT